MVCLQNLIIMPPRLHTRLPAVHSRLSLGPCRMIGGQDLLRGHNIMPIWVTCAPSMRHWRQSMDPHIGPKPFYALRSEAPRWQPRSHPPALVRAFWRPLQRPTHRAGVFTSQDSRSGCEAEAWQPFHSWRDQESHMQLNHQALMAFQQKSISTGEEQFGGWWKHQECIVTYVARLSQLAFPGKATRFFRKSKWDNTVVKKNKKIKIPYLFSSHTKLHTRLPNIIRPHTTFSRQKTTGLFPSHQNTPRPPVKKNPISLTFT